MTSTFPAHIIDLLPGQPYPSATTYQGLRYPGEVIFSEQWDSSWETLLRGHEFFRIVFLSTHQQVPSEDLQDSRIAVCVPSTSDRREQERKRERLIIREVRSRYGLPAADPSLLEQERQTYNSGTVLTRGGIDEGLQTSFEAPLPSDWVSSLSLSLLAWTYPQLPVQGAMFPRPITTEEAWLIFQGLIQQKTDPLGDPVEEDAPDRWRRLSEGLAVCPLPSDELPLDSQPTCPSCGLQLGAAAPSQEVGDAVRTLKVALREQNSRLSLRVISRILEGHRDERIDLFIKVVQTSDLSGLANVLNDRVERFLRELLAQP